jgi:hypothetical protein
MYQDAQQLIIYSVNLYQSTKSHFIASYNITEQSAQHDLQQAQAQQHAHIIHNTTRAIAAYTPVILLLIPNGFLMYKVQ